jgi:ABC-type nitrate/sulfonate/bicarbonate transport system permease component
MQSIGAVRTNHQADHALPRATLARRRADGISFVVVGASGSWWLGCRYSHRLFPSLEVVAAAFVRLTGIRRPAASCARHAAAAARRFCAGGHRRRRHRHCHGRSRLAEETLLPLVSIAAPIPGIAYAPLFLLWFGLGNVSAVLLVGFVSTFPIVFNTWTGVRR